MIEGGGNLINTQNAIYKEYIRRVEFFFLFGL